MVSAEIPTVASDSSALLGLNRGCMKQDGKYGFAVGRTHVVSDEVPHRSYGLLVDYYVGGFDLDSESPPVQN
jgi:hypothetical protein